MASAILFMASDLSSGITGQALDVNCGEYKALMTTARTDVGTVDDLHASAVKAAASTTSASTTTTTARRSACCSSRSGATPT